MANEIQNDVSDPAFRARCSVGSKMSTWVPSLRKQRRNFPDPRARTFLSCSLLASTFFSTYRDLAKLSTRSIAPPSGSQINHENFVQSLSSKQIMPPPPSFPPPRPPHPHSQPPQPQVSSSSHPHLLVSPSSRLPLDDDQRKRKLEGNWGHSALPSAPTPPPRSSGGSSARIVACSECRRLKIKCDRVFPCANCRRRGLATIW